MDEPRAEMPQPREYRIRSWQPTLMIALGLVIFMWAVYLTVTFTLGLVHVERPSGFDTFKGLFWLCVAVFYLVQGALSWDYRVTIDEVGVRVRSLILDRHVRWDDVQWCDVHDCCRQIAVVIGRPRGRALVIGVNALRPRGEVLKEVLSRVGEPRYIRVRQVVLAAMIVLPLAALLVAVETGLLLAWVGAAIVGIVSGLSFTALRSRCRRRAAWGLAPALCLGVAVIVWAASHWLHAVADLPRIWTTIALIGGWVSGFMLVRVHEEMMRGVPGADWTGEAKSLPAYAFK